VIGETTAHALMGPGSYMKTYYRRAEQEKGRRSSQVHAISYSFGESPDKIEWKQEANLEARAHKI
jgi:hypothetical protein